MTDPDQCIICLEALPHPPTNTDLEDGASTDYSNESPPAAAEKQPEKLDDLDIIASLDGCDHIIHDSCIRAWAKQTNTCPICRIAFNKVHVLDGLTGKPQRENKPFWFNLWIWFLLHSIKFLQPFHHLLTEFLFGF
jgi:hypothetical protein